jgi:hypothetical protein
MPRRFAFVLAVMSCTGVLAAGPAQAHTHPAQRLAVSLVPVDRSISCAPDDLFGIAFDVQSLGGRSLGTGGSCVQSLAGCDPFVPFCHRSVEATMTLALADGTLTAPLRLHEVLPTEASFLQRGAGPISTGTGAYTGAAGWIRGGGFGAFTETGFAGRLIYVVHLRRGGHR